MNKWIKSAVAVAACSLAVSQANATIIGGDVTAGVGSFVELTIPFTISNPDNTVGNNTFQNNNLYAFNEGQNITITSALSVDDVGGGSAGTLAAGTVVASHYVFFDPRQSRSQEGYVTFDSDIIGLVTSTGNLLDSDYLLNNGVTYQNPGARGLESNDDAWFSGNTVYVDWRASTPGDYIRVLTAYSPTAAVSEPAGLLFFAAGLLGLGLSRRKRTA